MIAPAQVFGSVVQAFECRGIKDIVDSEQPV